MYSSMDRSNSPVCTPCCCNAQKQGSPNPSNRYRQPPGENYTATQNVMPYYDASTPRRFQSFRNTQVNNSCSPVDGQTLNILSNCRQKATEFLRSDSENSESSYGVPNRQCRCQSADVYRSPNVLRQANDLIDYTPESQFLKKMKQQCQYLQNNQPNVFSTLDSCDGQPHECQTFIEKVKEVLSMGEQIKGNKYRPQSEGGRDTCPCSHRLREMHNAENCNNSQRVQREPGMLVRSNIGDVNEDMNEKILQKTSVRTAGTADSGAGGKRSEHVSRSKKVKCRGRRKRKSDSSEKCESEEKFEPNLKKPHENSCERCWRYASPSRSPVNKPDQRYDPNFRRGHSTTDFNNERGDGDLEIAGKHLGTSKNMQPITTKDKTLPTQRESSRQQREVIPQNTQLNVNKTQCNPQAGFYPEMNAQLNPQAALYGQQKTQFSPQVPAYTQQKMQCTPQHYQFANQQQHQLQQNDESFTKVKQLMYNYCPSKSPEKNSPRVQPSSQPCQYDGRRTPSPGILQADSVRKPRPKSYSGVISNTSPEDLPNYVLDTTDYYDPYTKPNQGAEQNAANKSPPSINGSKIGCLCGKKNVGSPVTVGCPAAAGSPAKVVTPSMPSRVGISPKPSSTPQKASRSITSRSPEQYATTPSPKADTAKPKGSKTPSPKAKTTKTPRTPANLSVSFATDSTVYAEISVRKTPGHHSPKNSPRIQSDKSPKKSPSPKSKPKTSQSPRRGSKSSPKTKCSPKTSPKRVQSSADVVEIDTTSPEERPQIAAEPDEECQRAFPEEGVERYYPNSPHLVRDCWCPPRAPFVPGCEPGATGRVFCCHCNWQENLKKREAEQRAGRASPNAGQNVQHNQMNEPLQKIPSEDVLGVECPYRAYQIRKKAENDMSWEAEYQNLRELFLNNPKALDDTLTRKLLAEANNMGTGSRTYHVYYMTQSKRNKGDDVEVLVEELTQERPKQTEWRTKDITDKMKRIMECPSDSMALRFQKGVSESSKTPQSSRILYF